MQLHKECTNTLAHKVHKPVTTGFCNLRLHPYIDEPRHIVEERMQPFHLLAIERGGGAAVSAADFYAFQPA